MGPLVILFLCSAVSLSCSLTSDIFQERQLYNLNAKIHILHDLLAKECPGYLQGKRDVDDLQKLRLETLTAQVKDLERMIIECRQGIGKTPTFHSKTAPTTIPTPSTTPTTTATTSTAPTTTHTSSTTPTTTLTPSTTPTTTPAPSCPSYDGDSVFDVLLISYHNPTNTKASGVLCNPDGSPCTIFLEICVSPIGSSSCEFYYQLTDVVGDQSKISIPYHLGNLTNPLRVNLGNRMWQGAHVRIIVLEGNPANHLKVYHEVDEFSYDLTDVQGSHHRLLTLHGKRFSGKTELVVMFTVPCPSPPITMTTTTTLPTTTSSPVPAECLTATNLTQSWRLDHSGKNIKGGGPQAYNGYACDRSADLGWFRFTGAAGTHMLDTCPKYKSCGTEYPHWTDDTPPQAVGVTANILGFGASQDNCRHRSWPLQVMRCSLNTDHDVIYRYYGHGSTGVCNDAYCGMI